MNTSPFDPRVKRTHSKLQAMVLLAARYPKGENEDRDRHVEQDAEFVNAHDAAQYDGQSGEDIFEAEAFEVEDELVGDDF